MSTTTKKKAPAVKKTKASPGTTAQPTATPNDGAEAVRHDVGRLEYLDPFALTVDPFNHRKKRQQGDTTEPDPKLIASVEARGVRVPLLVRPQADGTYGIVWGQRRHKSALLAAQKAQKAQKPYALVPCLIRDDLAGADDEALLESMIENDQRSAAHARDNLDALEQLALMDISDTKRAQHARSLGYKPAEVKAANRAAALSDTVLGFALGEAFDLVQAAEFAEVEDVPGAFDTLREAKEADDEDGAGRGHWAHALEELREEQRHRAQREEAEAALKAAGVREVRYLANYSHTTGRPLTELRSPLGNPIDADQHKADCDGHAAALDPDDLTPLYLCTAWEKHGHQLADGTKKTEQDTAAEQTRKEEEREARRRTIAYNKAWRAARTVRAEFIKTLCARKEISDPARTFVLSTVTGFSHGYARYVGRKDTSLMSQFLGITDPNAERSSWNRVPDPFGPLIAKTGKARWWRPLLAQAAATVETESMHDNAWRSPTDDLCEWLELLRAEGYTLAEVEAEMVERVAAARQKTATS